MPSGTTTQHNLDRIEEGADDYPQRIADNYNIIDSRMPLVVSGTGNRPSDPSNQFVTIDEDSQQVFVYDDASSSYITVGTTNFAGNYITESSNNLNVNLGNGLESDGSDNIRVRADQVAGNVLSEDTTNPYEIDVNLGNGVENNSGNIRVNPSDIAGSLLQEDGSNQLEVIEGSIDHDNIQGVSTSDHHTRPSAGDGLTDDSDTFNINVSDFAGSLLQDDGSDNLEVIEGSIDHDNIQGVSSDDHHPQIDARDNGSSVTDGPEFINFTDNLNVTASGTGVTVDASGVGGSAVDISDNGSLVVSGTSNINFSSGLDVTDDSDGTVTVDANISTSEANFTDQQLGTTDSPSFSGQTLTSEQVINISGGVPITVQENGTDRLTIDYNFSEDYASFRTWDSNASSISERLRIIGQTSLSSGPIILDSSGNIDANGGDILNAGSVQFSDNSGDGTKWEISERSNDNLQIIYGPNDIWQFANDGSEIRSADDNWDSNTGTNAIIDSSGDLQKDSGSSRRFKSEIQPAEITMDQIMEIEPKHFLHEQIDEYRRGLIAEEVQDAGFGEWVNENKNGEVESLSYGKFGATVALAGIRNLHERVKKLEEAE